MPVPLQYQSAPLAPSQAARGVPATSPTRGDVSETSDSPSWTGVPASVRTKTSSRAPFASSVQIVWGPATRISLTQGMLASTVVAPPPLRRSIEQSRPSTLRFQIRRPAERCASMSKIALLLVTGIVLTPSKRRTSESWPMPSSQETSAPETSGN